MNTLIRNTRWAAVLAGVAVAFAAGSARGQVQREVLASAGTSVESGGQVITLTLGEPVVGRGGSGSMDVASGFLAGSDESASADCCVLKGDLDRSGSRTPADIVFLVNAVLRGGPSPSCFGEADLNGNGVMSVSDIVLLIGDVFRATPLPLACGEAPTVAPRIAHGGEQVRVAAGAEKTRIVVSVRRTIAAVQLNLSGQGQDVPTLQGAAGWQLQGGRAGDRLVLGALDMSGVSTLAAGDSLVIELVGSYQLNQALLSTPDGVDVIPDIQVLARESVTPDSWELEQCVPNPFNPETRIAFSLPEETYVRLDVFNVLGRHVATPIEGVLAAGRHSIVWNASSLPSGVYLYRLHSHEYTQTKQMMLLK